MKNVLLTTTLLGCLLPFTWASGMDAKKLAGIWLTTAPTTVQKIRDVGFAEFVLNKDGTVRYRTITDEGPMSAPGCKGNYQLQKATLLVVISNCSAIGAEQPLALTFAMDLSGVTLQQFTSYGQAIWVSTEVSGIPGEMGTETVVFSLTKQRESIFQGYDSWNNEYGHLLKQ